jgi:hypothetical protein
MPAIQGVYSMFRKYTSLPRITAEAGEAVKKLGQAPRCPRFFKCFRRCRLGASPIFSQPRSVPRQPPPVVGQRAIGGGFCIGGSGNSALANIW